MHTSDTVNFRGLGFLTILDRSALIRADHLSILAWHSRGQHNFCLSLMHRGLLTCLHACRHGSSQLIRHMH